MVALCRFTALRRLCGRSQILLLHLSVVVHFVEHLLSNFPVSHLSLFPRFLNVNVVYAAGKKTISPPTLAAVIMLKHLIPDSDFWHKYWNKNCDPRTVNLWLMHGGPWKLLAISLGYALTIVAGLRFMRNRKPFEIRLPMLAYNVALIVINAYFLYKSFWWTNYGYALLSFRFPSPHDRSTRAESIIGLYQCYLWTKFLDYLDTIFFILRKKNSQITTLHIYHHISVPMVGWVSNWMSPTMPLLGLFVMLNSFCHILMYTYYALAAFGHRVQAYLWWKKYLTQVQLIQFAIIGVYGLCLNAFHTNYPFAYRMLPVSQSIIYLVLFGDFYYKSYKRTSEGDKAEGRPMGAKQD